MQGTKGMHGFTLHPGKAYLEIQVRLYNRTALPQTFLWWANPAVHVDEHHQSVFPPDVRAVMDHGKRDVSTFPLATGTYYKVNYAPGTDISRYRNIPVPTSYMAYRSSFDFVGSYDHGRQAGLLHIAPHHIAPGKKQWTWGHGDFGQAWERELTDDDGPYIELMCGAYTDNQPDFSWLMPGEEKSFSQFFLPYKGVGVVQNATVDAAVSLALEGDAGVLRAYTSSVQPGCRAVIQSGDQTLFAATFDGTPTTSFEARVAPAWADGSRDVEVVIEDRTGRPLVTWRPRACPDHGMPEPAQALPAPVELDSVEALYLAGLHLEQYRHATRRPEDYYREGLRRDPGDARCCNALGRWLYRHGCADEAEQLFRAAIARLTRHNPNPCDGEPYYNLGRTLLWQSRWNEAYEAFYKATWNAAWQDAAFFQLARIAVRRGDLADAARHLASCLRLNAAHHQAVHLQVVLLVLQQRTEEALHATRDELARDPFNTGVLFEAMALDGRWRQTFVDRMRRASHNYVELALDYAEAGLWERAAAVLNEYLQQVSDEGDSPLVHYFPPRTTASSGRWTRRRLRHAAPQPMRLTTAFPIARPRSPCSLRRRVVPLRMPVHRITWAISGTTTGNTSSPSVAGSRRARPIRTSRPSGGIWDWRTTTCGATAPGRGKRSHALSLSTQTTPACSMNSINSPSGSATPHLSGWHALMRTTTLSGDATICTWNAWSCSISSVNTSRRWTAFSSGVFTRGRGAKGRSPRSLCSPSRSWPA
jgi:tetratricopeptide (TPR) repeat protein